MHGDVTSYVDVCKYTCADICNVQIRAIAKIDCEEGKRSPQANAGGVGWLRTHQLICTLLYNDVVIRIV